MVFLHHLMGLVGVPAELRLGDEQTIVGELRLDRSGPDQEGQLADTDEELPAGVPQRELEGHERLSSSMRIRACSLGVPARPRLHTRAMTARVPLP